jgi:hypothetical protein
MQKKVDRLCGLVVRVPGYRRSCIVLPVRYEHASFRLVAQCPNQLRYSVPLKLQGYTDKENEGIQDEEKIITWPPKLDRKY